MKRNIYILIIFLLSVFQAVAQQRISVELDRQPITRLFEIIERQTGSRIYCTPGEADTLKVTIMATNLDPLDILREALQPTPYKVTRHRNAYYIHREKEFFIPMLDNFYITETVQEKINEIDKKTLLEDEWEKRTVSEQTVHEIGNAKAPKTGMVTLSGNITHNKTGEPLPGITLFIENPRIGATTDGFGHYVIHLPAGRQELNIRGLDVRETQRQLMLYSDGILNIELEEKIFALGEVVVMASRVNNIKSTSIGVEYLKMKDIKNIPTAFGETDVLRIVMALPGVKSAGEISSGFNVRGGATDQNLILYNGCTIFNPTHLFGMFSAFNPDVVNDMELYKSNIPAKYGGRISSVLEINSREGNKKKFQGSGSLGLITSRLSIEGPVFNGKGSFILGGRTTYSNWLLKMIPKESGYSNGRAGFYDLNGSFVNELNEKNKLFISGYLSNDRFSFNQYEQYGYRNANVSTKWRHVFSPRLINILTLGYDHNDNHLKTSEDPYTAFSYTYKINQGFLKSEVLWFSDNHHSLSFGINAILYNLNPGVYLPYDTSKSLSDPKSKVVEDRIQNEKALESAIYIGDDWEITPKFSVSAGVRYSMFNALGPRFYNMYLAEQLPSIYNILGSKSVTGIFKTYHGPEFRFSTRYAFSNDLSIKAGFNTMRQYIHKISNTTLMSPTDTWKLSDANILPQTGMQIAGGIFKNFSKIEASIEVYYKSMKDYLDYRPGAKLVMNHHIETEVVNSTGKSYGAELMLKKTTGILNGWISYTYSRTMLRQADPKITLPANEGNWFPADFDKPHELKFTGNYKFTHRYSLSLNVDYSTGRPITLPEAKYRHFGGVFVYYTYRNKYRIPDYFRIDLSFNIEPSHHLTLLTHSSLSFGLYNLTARKNAYSVYYINEGAQPNGYKMSIFGTVIPFVAYNIKF